MLPFETLLRTPTRSEEVALSFRLDWYGDRDIAVYTLAAPPLDSDEVDLFMARVARMLAEWPPEKPLRVIFTIHQAARTPYLRHQMQHVLDTTRAESEGRVAFVFPDRDAGQVVRLFVRRQNIPKLETHTFARVTAAAAWVESYDLRPAETRVD